MNWWEDQKIINGEKLEYRAILNDSKKIIKNLEGNWDFKYFEDISIAETEPESLIFEQVKWDVMPVPGCWEMNGYGDPNYVNTKNLFPTNVPHIDCANPAGVYQKIIDIKSTDIKNNKAILRLHGLDSIAKIFINDNFVAIDKSARVTSEFEITKYVNAGKNKIQLIVAKFSDLSYLEDQDMWRFGGIFRDVELVFESPNGIRDVYVRTDTNYKNKTAKLVVDIMPYKETNGSIEISKDGKFIKSINFDTKISSKSFMDLNDIKLWSDDYPELYDLKIITKENDIKMRIGFKDIEIKDRKFLVNGVPIKLRGVNMHDFTPTAGRVMDKKTAMKNLKIMKEHNINAIRTSHYPKANWFYELCNEIGIWVMDEADLEAHGTERIGNWDFYANDPIYIKHHVIKAKQMALRDRNNVSIFSFSLGNEAGFGPGFEDMATYIKSVTSPSDIFIHYEGDYEAKISDVHSSMYAELESTPDIIKNKKYNKHDKLGGKTLQMIKDGYLLGEKFESILTRPHVDCEYAHAMGNSAGSFKDYWDFFNANDSFMGGFVWEWFDQGLKIKGRKDYLYGGDFKHIKNDSNFCIDGMIMPDLTPSPFLIESKQVHSPIDMKIDSSKKELSIINRYNFAQIKDKAKITLFVKNFEGKVLSKMNVKIPPIKRFAEFKFKLPKQPESYIANVVAKGNDNIIISKISAKIGAIKSSFVKPVKRNVSISRSETVVSGSDDSFIISGFNGAIKYIKNEKIILSGNLLNFWRPIIDNERLRKTDEWINNFRLDISETRLVSIKDISLPQQTKLVVTTRTSTPNQPWGFETKTKYSFTENGVEIDIVSKDTFNLVMAPKPFRDDYGFFIQPKKIDSIPFYIPRLGFDFNVDKSYILVKYLGLGPEENYCDSMVAAKYDFYETNIDGLWTNYVRPQENGNRQGVNKLELSNKNNKIIIESGEGFSFNYAKFSQRVIDKAMHPSELREDKNLNYLSINYKNGPIGSASCGPIPLFKYLLRPKSFKMKYRISFE